MDDINNTNDDALVIIGFHPGWEATAVSRPEGSPYLEWQDAELGGRSGKFWVLIDPNNGTPNEYVFSGLGPDDVEEAASQARELLRDGWPYEA